MRIIAIPKTSLQPSVLCMGTADFGGAVDRQTAYDLLDAFLDHGGNFLDTAQVYSDWIPGERSRSEKLLGEWMNQRKNRERIILATKGAHPDLSSMHIPRLSPAEIITDLEGSLNHLRTDVIDLYWLHRDDPTRPVAEIIATLAEQAQIGKIRYFGCSNWGIDRLKAAQDFAAANALPGFAAVQNLWNLAKINLQAVADPTLVVMDDELHKYHHQNNLTAVPFSSQANGLFQKLEAGQAAALSKNHTALYLNAETEQRLKRIRALRAQTGLNTTQLVLGYLLSQPFPTVPVFSSRNMNQLEDTLSAAGVQLTREQVAFLEHG
jgi:aryl-alcohol dehydrogenase-like predicted oxidoreductase